MRVPNCSPPEWDRPRLQLPQAFGRGLQPPFGQVEHFVVAAAFARITRLNNQLLGKKKNILLFLLLAEVCVDKARLDEYEQRASELAQKASLNNSSSDSSAYSHVF